MVSTYINPGDLKTIYLDYLIGSPALLVYVLIFLVSFPSAYFQMSQRNFGFLLVISSLLFAAYIGIIWYFFILIILGFILFKGFARMFS